MRVRDLMDGQDVEAVLLVRGHEVRTRPDGTAYLRLTLADRTGQVLAVLRDGPGPEEVRSGIAVHVRGEYSSGGTERPPRLLLRAVRPAQDAECDWSELLDGPAAPVEQLEADLRSLVSTVQNPHLRALLSTVFEGPVYDHFRIAPAAKRYHQAYRHGLLEHTLTVAQGVSAMSSTFPGIDRDVAVCGALLHDIGKLEAYTSDSPAIEMTDSGKLQGEIALGYYRIRRSIEDLPGFPADLAAAVLHIILAHHGSLEYGSPVVPCTREATLVHMVDNLGGRLGSFDRLEKELPQGSLWSGYDRALGGGAYFGMRAAA